MKTVSLITFILITILLAPNELPAQKPSEDSANESTYITIHARLKSNPFTKRTANQGKYYLRTKKTLGSGIKVMNFRTLKSSLGFSEQLDIQDIHALINACVTQKNWRLISVTDDTADAVGSSSNSRIETSATYHFLRTLPQDIAK